jgi:hypothetical protein
MTTIIYLGAGPLIYVAVGVWYWAYVQLKMPPIARRNVWRLNAAMGRVRRRDGILLAGNLAVFVHLVVAWPQELPAFLEYMREDPPLKKGEEGVPLITHEDAAIIAEWRAKDPREREPEPRTTSIRYTADGRFLLPAKEPELS